MHSGTGMNAVELYFNDQLTAGYKIIRSLSQDFKFPFHNESLDVIICVLWIEYLVDPVIAGLARMSTRFASGWEGCFDLFESWFWSQGHSHAVACPNQSTKGGIG